jgi:hypothetical protein
VHILKRQKDFCRQKDLKLHLKLLEKQEQEKPKTSRMREIIKIRAKINEIETKKTQRIKKLVLDSPLTNLTKMRREKTQIRKIRNAKGEITTNTTEIYEIIETTLRTYILINLKILKKWTNF